MDGVVRKSVVAAMVLAALTGCKDKDAARQTNADSAVAAKRADVNNPQLGEKVSVQLSEWQVTSSRNELPKGQVTFAVQNQGKLPHVVEIKGGGGDWKSMAIPPGEQILMAMVVDKPGDYEILCPDSAGSHEKRGMSAHFTVK